MKTRWYKDAVVYQIYPRSFCDSNGDGIGDIKGIISKLDYLQELGIDAVWLSPCYKSPNDDNGYDISDYRDIMDDFGTLDDWKKMLDGMHKRGIKLIMDLVANHTSDEHEWFKRSRESVDNPYRDYYIWRKGRGDDGRKPPNNWTSNFLGSAWQYDKVTDEFYLHLFSKKQPDLNWDNPRVRKEIADICNFWFKLGVDGFRCDVITYISKKNGLPNGQPFNFLRGSEHYCMGENYHQYILELNRESWSKFDSMIVGEAVGISKNNAYANIDERSEQLDCVFCFDNNSIGANLSTLIRKKYPLRHFKKVFSEWQALPKTCQPTLFLENHDQPRSLPRYVGDCGARRVQAGKMLAVAVQLQRGTPFVYQGQEIGMTNCPFANDEYADIMSINTLRTVSKHLPFLSKWAGKILNKFARDNARTPMQWSDKPNAGFTSGTPWMKVNPNYKDINVEQEKSDPNSVLAFYKKLIAFRKGNDVIINGLYREYQHSSKKVFVYSRKADKETLLIVCNFVDKQVKFNLPKQFVGKTGECALSNYDGMAMQTKNVLRPFEAVVWKIV
ncbi:MAG: alpha-glucosidase [Clostridia bacterium]